MFTHRVPKMRFILIKSEGQFKHSGKYYLQAGRWHKLHPNKPVPKGAAVASHPHAAGAPVQGKPFTDDEWNQVIGAFKLDISPDNSNAKDVIKKLNALKHMAETGDVTGLLGMQFGTNSYSKNKLVPLANYILGQLGSTHKVVAGQKAGEHQAVQAAPAPRGNDWMTMLFGPSDGNEKPAAAPSVAPQKVDPAAVGEAITSSLQSAEANLQKWQSKSYKPNAKQVELHGDGPSNQASMSVGAINEGKKQKAIAAAWQEVNALKKLQSKISTPEGLQQVSSMIASTMADAKNWFAAGTANVKTESAGDYFEYLILEKIGIKSAYGSIMSNDVSKVLRAVAEGKPVPKAPVTVSPAADAKPDAEPKPEAPQAKTDVTNESKPAADWKPSFDEMMGLSLLPKEQQVAKLKEWQAKLGSNAKLVQVLQEAQAEAKKKDAAASAPKPVSTPKPAAAPAPKKQFAVGDLVHGFDIAELPPGSVVSFHNRTALIGHGNVWFNKQKGSGWQKNPLTPSQRASFLAGKYSKEGAKVVGLGSDGWMHEAQKAGVESILKIKAEKGGNPQAFWLGSSVVVGEIGKPHAFVWVGEDGAWGAGFTDKDKAKFATGEGLKPVEMGAQPAADAGPKEGDTKKGADGTLVFKDGRWHKQETAAAKPDPFPSFADHAAADAAAEAASTPSMPAFQEGKTVSGVVAYYEGVGQKVIDMAAAGDVAGLEKLKVDGLKPNSKGKVSNTWAGKTPNSKLLLALHAEALLHAGKNAAVQHLTQDQKQDDIPASEKKEDAELVAKLQGKPAGEAVAAALDHLKGDKDQGDLPAAEQKEDAELVQKLEAAQGKPAEQFEVTADGYVAGKYGYPQQYANKKQAEAKVEKLVAAGYEAHVSFKHPFKIVVTKKPGNAPAAKEPRLVLPKKEAETAPAFVAGLFSYSFGAFDLNDTFAAATAKVKSWAEKHPDQKSALLSELEAKGDAGEDLALEAGLYNSPKPAAPSLAGVPAWEHLKKFFTAGDFGWGQSASTADLEAGVDAWLAANKGNEEDMISALVDMGSTKLSKHLKQKYLEGGAPAAAQQPGNDKLAQINWDGLKLPDSNKNAKSHNKQIEKIKALAMAGDVAGLEALKFGTNTYGKKQELLKQTAIAALKEGGAPAVAADKSALTPDKKAIINTLFQNAEHGGIAALQSVMAGYPEGSETHEYAKRKMEKLQNQKVVNEALQSVKTSWKNWVESGDTNYVKQAVQAYEDSNSGGDWDDLIAYGKQLLAGAGAKVEAAPTGTIVGEPGKGTYFNKTMNGWVKIDPNGMESSPYSPEKNMNAMLELAAGHDLPVAWIEAQKSKPVHQAEIAKEVTADLAVEYGANPTHVLGQIYPAGGEDGPKEGDTKVINGVTYVLKNGRWHKQGEDVSANTLYQLKNWMKNGKPTKGSVNAEMQAAWDKLTPQQQFALEAEVDKDATPAPAEPSGPPVPPEFTAGSGSATWAKNYATVAAALHAKVKAEGATAFKGVVTSHTDGKFTIKLAGFKLKHVGPNDPQEYHQQMHAYVQALMASTGKASKKPKAAAAPKVAVAPAAAASFAGAIESMDSWQQTGPQGGSNPGGRFKDENGVEWYCKFPADEDMAKAEVLAAKLYAALGIAGQDAKLITKDGKIGIASRWQTVSKVSPAELAKADGVASGFGADAWLANWDVVGLGYDNLQIGSDGKAMRVDAGGSLMYRAQGGKKAFGSAVTEIDSLRDPKINPQAAKVFGGLTEADITASVAKVLALSDTEITALVYQHGPGDMAAKKSLTDTLIARKADLAAKFPKAAPKAASQKQKAPVYRIPTPPDFKNWKAPGVGLSSKPAFNEQNQQLTQAIYEAGLKGDVDAAKNLTYQPINEKGEVIGSEKSIMNHPSKHIPDYLKDVLHAMTTPYVSPKISFRDAAKNLSSAFVAMRVMFPGFKALKDAAVKIGRYALLGKVTAGHPLEGWKPNLVSRKQGTLDEHALFKASQAGFKSLSQTERNAIRDYTGSGYDSMNNALIQGISHDMAYNAVAGMEKASVLLPVGAVLSRRFKFDKAADGSQSKANHDKALAELISAGEGAILQEFGIISTSTRSDFWSGRVHLKITVGEGVKGLYVASDPGASGVSPISLNPGESEIMLPFGTKFMVTKIHPKGHKFKDDTGSWGHGGSDEIVIEVTALPNI